MSFKIKQLSYSNLKYVGSKEVNLDLNKSLILLDGPNGYGKSTVFDAMELLLTGKIDHSTKGKMAVLANDKKNNIFIKGTLEIEGKNIEINRSITAESNFQNEIIYWNEELINQDDLYRRLKFSKSSMGVATYVSQLKSLSYLEKKENDRKKIVAELIDDNQYNTEIVCLEEFKNTLKNKVETELKEVSKKLNNEIQKRDQLLNQIQQINEIQGKKGFQKLFELKEYGFDQEQLDKSIGYSEMIKPLNDLKSFLENYTTYQNTKRNTIISSVLSLNEKQIKSLYYKKENESIKGYLKLYKDIEKLEKIVPEKKINDIHEINKLLQVQEDEINDINNIVTIRNNLISTSERNDKCVLEFIESRNQLNKSYKNGIQNKLWNENKCPFCGKENANLEEVFLNAEKILTENNSLIIERVNELDLKIEEYFNRRASQLAELIRINNSGYDKYLKLKYLLNIDLTQEVKDVLEAKKFYSSNIDETEFQIAFQKLKNDLEEEQKNLGDLLEDSVVGKYESIENEYYFEQELHSFEQINDKISYIASWYSDDYKKALNESINKIEILNKDINEQQKANKIMIDYTDKYLDKYRSAFKEYQSKLVQTIKIPLYIYSGKVIQNYPLGLGVIAKIKSTQIIFETEKKNEDIFEYLSAGQLNGIMLSIMLAVRSVMNLDKSINLIMIDDPLQTIDDVSAFSYADLLAEQFGDAQIILSTHEDDKSDLLEFKFRQHERSVIKYNMHDKYLLGE